MHFETPQNPASKEAGDKERPIAERADSSILFAEPEIIGERSHEDILKELYSPEKEEEDISDRDVPTVDVLKRPGVWAYSHPLELVPDYNGTGELPETNEAFTRARRAFAEEQKRKMELAKQQQDKRVSKEEMPPEKAA